jgi:hypothetical protein
MIDDLTQLSRHANALEHIHIMVDGYMIVADGNPLGKRRLIHRPHAGGDPVA